MFERMISSSPVRPRVKRLVTNSSRNSWGMFTRWAKAPMTTMFSARALPVDLASSSKGMPKLLPSPSSWKSPWL